MQVDLAPSPDGDWYQAVMAGRCQRGGSPRGNRLLGAAPAPGGYVRCDNSGPAAPDGPASARVSCGPGNRPFRCWTRRPPVGGIARVMITFSSNSWAGRRIRPAQGSGFLSSGRTTRCSCWREPLGRCLISFFSSWWTWRRLRSGGGRLVGREWMALGLQQSDGNSKALGWVRP